MSVTEPATMACTCGKPSLGIIDGDNDSIYCGNCNAQLGYLDSVILQAEEFNKQRAITFAQDNSDCKHQIIYNKQGEDMHCHQCDKFIYNESKGE